MHVWRSFSFSHSSIHPSINQLQTKRTHTDDRLSTFHTDYSPSTFARELAWRDVVEFPTLLSSICL